MVEPQRYGALDGMRALAAYGVLATHTGFNTGRSLDSGPFAPLLARLDFGVTVFFLLSGFLLYRPFAASAIAGTRAPDVRRFYLRRALRILPAYWLAVLVTLSWLSERSADGGDYASYLLLVQTYNHHNLDPSLTQMWTLVVEISFYAVLPPLALAVRGRRGGAESAVGRQLALLLGLVAVAAGSDLAAHHGWHHRPGEPDLAAGQPGLVRRRHGAGPAVLPARVRSDRPVGPAAHRVARLARELATAPGTCWVIGGLLFWTASLPVGGPRNLLVPTGWEWTIKHWLYALAALLLLLPLTLGSGGLIGRLLSSAPAAAARAAVLRRLPVAPAVAAGHPARARPAHLRRSLRELFVLTALAATAVAALSWFGMERPLLRLGSSGPGAAAATSSRPRRPAAPARSRAEPAAVRGRVRRPRRQQRDSPPSGQQHRGRQPVSAAGSAAGGRPARQRPAPAPPAPGRAGPAAPQPAPATSAAVSGSGTPVPLCRRFPASLAPSAADGPALPGTAPPARRPPAGQQQRQHGQRAGQQPGRERPLRGEVQRHRAGTARRHQVALLPAVQGHRLQPGCRSGWPATRRWRSP